MSAVVDSRQWLFDSLMASPQWLFKAHSAIEKSSTALQDVVSFVKSRNNLIFSGVSFAPESLADINADGINTISPDSRITAVMPVFSRCDWPLTG